jgi:hypothetical protein
MPRAAGSSAVWRKNESALTRRTTRSVLVLAERSDEPVRLDGFAMMVWDALDVPSSDERLVDSVAARTGADGPALRADVVATRRALGDIGAITEAR